jgi:SNF2 family DNA or RNA helicase
MLASGGKALVFSQFVGYLQHCRERLEAMAVDYCYLDGSTSDRGAVVKQFQTDPSKRVFLISLKAGGYGLNLTEADQVYLLDPWWNPAVEAQAIDRAHRFGQTQVVNAYRLVMRGTVEERILALQTKKRGLIAATVEERAPLMQGLTDQDLTDLLEG